MRVAEGWGWALGSLVPGLLLAACSGELGSPSSPFAPSNEQSAPGNASPDGLAPAGNGIAPSYAELRFTCTDPAGRGRGRATMRRLTRDELVHSLEAILGSDVMKTAEVSKAAGSIPSEPAGDLVREFQNGHAFEHADGLLNTARAAARAVLAREPARVRLFGACHAKADAACIGTFLDKQGPRILKRPLDAARRDALLAAFQAVGQGDKGLELILSAILQAPEVVFHLERPRSACTASGSCTEAKPTDGRVEIDDWSIAARLAYAFTGRAPDDALLQAAGRGELRDQASVRAQAERLLELPAARVQFESLLNWWLHLEATPTPNPVIASEAGIDATGLAEEANRELLDFALHMVFEKEADAAELLTANLGFPKSERMAKIYGSSVAVGDQPVELNNGHGGLLLRAAPLLSGQTRSSPIMRGVYVRKRLLCDALPSPDFSVVSARTDALGAADSAQFSTREIAAEVTSPPACMSCHTVINPVGFALESFDPLGRPRTVEIAYDQADRKVAEHPIDATVTIPAKDGRPSQTLTGPEDVRRSIANSNELRSCIAERLFSTAQLRTIAPEDSCALAEVERALREGTSLREAWLLSVVNADLFWKRAEVVQ